MNGMFDHISFVCSTLESNDFNLDVLIENARNTQQCAEAEIHTGTYLNWKMLHIQLYLWNMPQFIKMSPGSLNI